MGPKPPLTSHVVRPEGLEPPTSRVHSGGSGVVARGRAEHESGVGGYWRTTPDSPQLVYGLVYGLAQAWSLGNGPPRWADGRVGIRAGQHALETGEGLEQPNRLEGPVPTAERDLSYDVGVA